MTAILKFSLPDLQVNLLVVNDDHFNVLVTRTCRCLDLDVSRYFRQIFNFIDTATLNWERTVCYTLQEHPCFSGVRVAQSSVFCVVFCGSSSLCPFSSVHCIVCPSSIYSFWLPIWYHQIFISSTSRLSDLIGKKGTDII